MTKDKLRKFRNFYSEKKIHVKRDRFFVCMSVVKNNFDRFKKHQHTHTQQKMVYEDKEPIARHVIDNK